MIVIEILSCYFKIFITNVRMSRFDGMSQNIRFQMSTVMAFYAFLNSTTTSTNVIFSTFLIRAICIVHHVMLMFEFTLVFYIKTSLSFLPVQTTCILISGGNNFDILLFMDLIKCSPFSPLQGSNKKWFFLAASAVICCFVAVV